MRKERNVVAFKKKKFEMLLELEPYSVEKISNYSYFDFLGFREFRFGFHFLFEIADFNSCESTQIFGK